MDPLTAVGLIANIAQFVDLGCKVFVSAREIRHSASGRTQDDQRMGDVISEMQMLSLTLQTPGKDPSDANEKALIKLANECQKLSKDILNLLNKTSARTSRSKSEAMRLAMRKLRYAKEREALEQRLNMCRSQLHIQLSYLSRYGRCLLS